MPADEIRRCVTITNGLKADLVVLTGDYLAWDPAAQGEVVQALAGLRAPYGVFGCLGNHEIDHANGRIHHPVVRRARYPHPAPGARAHPIARRNA